MHNAATPAIREEIANRARLRTLRRIERLDILVAMALLLLLIFGWAVDVASKERWWGGHLLTASHSPHA